METNIHVLAMTTEQFFKVGILLGLGASVGVGLFLLAVTAAKALVAMAAKLFGKPTTTAEGD